jgi:hypothetical protein
VIRLVRGQMKRLKQCSSSTILISAVVLFILGLTGMPSGNNSRVENSQGKIIFTKYSPPLLQVSLDEHDLYSCEYTQDYPEVCILIA